MTTFDDIRHQLQKCQENVQACLEELHTLKENDGMVQGHMKLFKLVSEDLTAHESNTVLSLLLKACNNKIRFGDIEQHSTVYAVTLKMLIESKKL